MNLEIGWQHLRTRDGEGPQRKCTVQWFAQNPTRVVPRVACRDWQAFVPEPNLFRLASIPVSSCSGVFEASPRICPPQKATCAGTVSTRQNAESENAGHRVMDGRRFNVP